MIFHSRSARGTSGLLRHLAAVAGLLFVASLAHGQTAIVPGFDSNTLAPNDDDSVGPIAVGFTLNFFGVTTSQLWVNNNGNVTLDAPLATYTPFDLTSTGQQIIAPFFSDVDTSSAGNPVTYGSGSFNGRPAFGVNWINVDYYESDPGHSNRNSFQLILVDRSDVAAGDFDIVFNYGQIQWEAGEASDGDANGLGGSSARAGYSNGTGNPGTFFELPGSAVNGALLDGGPNALVTHQLNSGVDGRYIFAARSGNIDPGPASTVSVSVPAGTPLGWLLLAMLMLLTGARVARRNAA